jgi:hypothetical protein
MLSTTLLAFLLAGFAPQPANTKPAEIKPTGRFEYAGIAPSILSETALTLGHAGMQPLGGSTGCPPNCGYMTRLAVPPGELTVLVRPVGGDVSIASLTLLVVNAQNRVVAQTDPVCKGCGTLLSVLKDAKAGHLFRLDATALKSLAAAYKANPGNLWLQIDGKGKYTVHAVKVGK